MTVDSDCVIVSCQWWPSSEWNLAFSDVSNLHLSHWVNNSCGV